jgi:hypothetical protein
MRPRDGSWWDQPPEAAIKNRYGNLAEDTRMRLGDQPSLRADPPHRRDGRCVNCHTSRPEIAVKNGDPFCSTHCARIWHDQIAESPSSGG